MTRPFVPFDSDPEPSGVEGRRAKENRRAAFRRMVEHAVGGQALTAEEVAAWHGQLLEGLRQVPDPCYLGGYRGSDYPWLRGYEVEVAPDLPGAPAGRVGEELERFFAQLAAGTAALAAEVPPAADKDRAAVRRVVELAVWAHGEWLRIHPFANGNGRTARLVANHVLARFRLAPVVRLRPRPAPPYTEQATESMRGNPAPLVEWMVELLESGVVVGS